MIELTNILSAYTSWLSQAIQVGVFAFLSFKIPKIAFFFIKSKFAFRDVFVKAFLYHRQTANVSEDILRISLIKIRPGLFQNIVVKQFNITPKTEMYKGSLCTVGDSLSMILNSSSQGCKSINAYRMKHVTKSNVQFSIGTISALNQDSDPWQRPCLLINKKIPLSIASCILDEIETPILTKTIRRAIEDKISSIGLDPHHSMEGSIMNPFGGVEVYHTEERSIFEKLKFW